MVLLAAPDPPPGPSGQHHSSCCLESQHSNASAWALGKYHSSSKDPAEYRFMLLTELLPLAPPQQLPAASGCPGRWQPTNQSSTQHNAPLLTEPLRLLPPQPPGRPATGWQLVSPVPHCWWWLGRTDRCHLAPEWVCTPVSSTSTVTASRPGP
jgi:hypothetical protein